MALTIKEIKELAKVVAHADRKSPVAYSFNGTDFSYRELNDTLRDELNALAPNYNAFRRNKIEIFELMQEVIDEVLPKKIMDAYGMFAEIKQYGQGQKPVFKVKKGRQRAAQFITKVGLAGIYEVFKLDTDMVEVQTLAYGGAAQIGLEEFLDGVVDFGEMLDIIMEGLDTAVYKEIAKALVGMRNQLPVANKAAAAGFDASKFDSLLAVASAYGTPVIYCTLELASKLLPESAYVSENMKNALNAQGYVGVYKGARVVVLPQSFEDENNSIKVLDPSFAYIIPAGSGNEKPVKIAFEGQTIVDEFVNADRSREIQVYKKFGVNVLVTNNICVYEDTSL